jgi:RimJ/RimL family protein N-acetyltransferase
MRIEHKNNSMFLGEPVNGWKTRPLPCGKDLVGNYCHLKRTSHKRDAKSLFDSFCLDKKGANWQFLPYGPFFVFEDFTQWLQKTCSTEDPFFYTIFDSENRAVGLASYLRINPPAGVIEVGHLNFSPILQRKTAATEAMYLMMRYAIEELGYRRYEWKCNNLNETSKKAALRLGFQFEGVFRQAAVYKNRNRDTAWFSIIDKEWRGIQRKMEKWLHPQNFDDAGGQKNSLNSL